MAKKKNPASDKAGPLEPQQVTLPAKPSFERKPEVKEAEHRVHRKPKGPYRAIKDLGKPTTVQENASDSPYPKR